MIETASREGFAVCIPLGLKDPKGKPSWNVGYPFQEGWKVDDVKSLSRIAAYVQKRYRLSRENTFLAGMSNGGEMCYLMAYSKQKAFKGVTFSFLLMSLVASHAQDAPEANGLSSVAQTSPPANVVKASVGPGLIYSKASTPTGIYTSQFCGDTDLTYQHLWRRGWGLEINHAFSVANYNHEHLITQNYIGPSSVFAFRRGKFGFDVSMGLGLAQYTERVRGRDYQNRIRTFKETEIGLGFYGHVGVEYIFCKHLGVGAQVTSLASLFPRPENDLVPEDENYGIQRVNVLIGPRVYF